MECYTNQPGILFYSGNFSREKNLSREHFYNHPIRNVILSLSFNIFISGFYIPNDGSVKGKGGVVYAKDGGFCLETEVYPDSVNQKSFPCDSILRPGQVYDHRVTYKFFDF